MSKDTGSERQPIAVNDLLLSGELARTALKQIADEQWEAEAEALEWTRLTTVIHICGALQFYATQLAVGSTEYTATVPLDAAAVKIEELPELVNSQSTVLARIAIAASAGTRAWHPSGSPDTEGFLAMGCAEVLLHAWDCVNATSVEFTPADGVADRVVQRLFPWAPVNTPRWQTLLWATGRGELAGHESPGKNWMWQNAPLDEWDGQEKRSERWSGK